MSTRFWWLHARIYELYVEKFARDFHYLTSKLDYFGFLGINTLHILPHYPSPMRDDGYDVSDYKNVRAELGTLDDFSRFIEAAHKNNIKVIIDLVLNHVSSEHPWFRAAAASKQNPCRDFFVWSKTGSENVGATNPFPDFKQSNWIRNKATSDYYYATFYPEQPDLNWEHPQVLAEMLSVIDFWVRRGVDGFRLDAAPYLIKRENLPPNGHPSAHTILRALRMYVEERYQGSIALLAEVGADIVQAKQYFGDGTECQLVYHFPLMREMLRALMDGSKSGVERMVAASFPAPEGSQWATFLRNHDEVSLATLPERERKELLRFIDPENRYPFRNGTASSVRLGTIFDKNPQCIIDAFSLLYMLPGAPVMYYGDEIGMKNFPSEPGIKDTRRYVRGTFDWAVVEQMLADTNSLLHKTARIIHHHAIR